MTPSRPLVAACAAALALTALPARAQLAGKKALIVNSYHEGYGWSDSEEKGARTALEAAGVKYDVIRMDVKRHQGDTAFSKAAALKVKAQIDATKPDVVITLDDPAVALVLVPFYNGSSLPFVFCGVNWDASRYPLGKNVTGVVEVSLVKELVDGLKPYAKGARVGFLTADAESEHLEGPNFQKALGHPFTSERYVKTLAEWKSAFQALQGEVDILIINISAGINDWSEPEARAFAEAGAKIPTGTISDFMMPYAMLGYTKVGEEQGATAVQDAIRILQGTPPAAIPVTANKQAKIFINPKLAARAGIVFKPELVKVAEVVK